MAAPEIACVVDARARVGEGAIWDVAERALYWVDIPAGLLHRFDPATGENRSWDVGEPLGCVVLREAGGVLLATASGFWFFDPASGAKTPVHDPEADKPDHRFNDGITDSRGRFWAGTMKAAGEPAPTGAFYRLDPDDLACHRWCDGFYTTNGLAFSPDGRTMYFSDSSPAVRTVWACAYDPDTGTPTGRRVFFDTRAVAGRPDGATVDADGCYWMAGVSGWQLVRLTPAGRVDRIVDLPVERPSRPMFGGDRLEVLYLTTLGTGLAPGSEARQPQAGGLFAISGLGVKGLAQRRFAG